MKISKNENSKFLENKIMPESFHHTHETINSTLVAQKLIKQKVEETFFSHCCLFTIKKLIKQFIVVGLCT